MSTSSRWIAFLLVIVVALLIATTTLIASASAPAPMLPNSPLQTKVAGTVEAVRTNALGTAKAVETDVRGTANAVRTKVGGTVNAVRTDVPGTIDAVRGNIQATLTAIAPTVNGYKAMYQQTATALRATASAFPEHLQETATAFASKVAVISSTLERTVLPGDQAASAVASYGQAILGTSVSIVSAHGANEQINGTYPLPDIITNWQSLSADLSVQNYQAVLSNGVAWLSYGSGTQAVDGGTPYNVQTESLGVYSVGIPGTVTDAPSAQALALATFPGLASKTYTQVNSTTGYAFYAYDAVTAPDPQTGKLTLMPESIVLYVLPGKSGQVSVTAAVGSGQYSALVQP